MATKPLRKQALAGMVVRDAMSGTVPRLTDPEPAKALKLLGQRFKEEPGFAKDWLIQNSLLTPTGKLPKRFGG